MAIVINPPAARATPVGPWLGTAIAVAFVLSSAGARADEPSVPPSTPAVVAPTPDVAAPTPVVTSSSTPDKEQPPAARDRAPQQIRDTSVLKPDVLPAKTGEAAPAGYHAEERIRTGLVVSGALVFGIPYVFSVISGAEALSHGNTRSGVLMFPVVGPFIMGGFVSGSDHGFNIFDLDGLFVLEGIVQVSGVAMLTVGLLAKRRIFVRDDVAKSFVIPMPMRFGANSAGVGVVGTF